MTRIGYKTNACDMKLVARTKNQRIVAAMNGWLLIVYLLTADGPKQTTFDIPNGQGRQCENWARELRLSMPVVREGIIYDARCVREYET